MVDLVALLEAAQDPDGVGHGRLSDVHRLEASLECRVLLDGPVLRERRRTDHAQPSTRQQRLEHVRRIHRALGRTGTHHGVELIDEGDDASLRGLDLLEHGLESLLELSAVLRTGDHGRQVELHEGLVLEQRGHITLDDAARQPFDDRGLSHPRLADEDRIVLRPAHQHLDGPPDLLIPSDDGVESTLACGGREVARVLRERLVGCLRIG